MLDIVRISPARNGNGKKAPRRSWGSYRASLEECAVAAAHEVRHRNWPRNRAARLFGVNTAYVGLVLGLDTAAHRKLMRGELSLAQLWDGYKRTLTERRAAQQAAKQPPMTSAGCSSSMRRIRAMAAVR
jgi:hypothetical protein